MSDERWAMGDGRWAMGDGQNPVRRQRRDKFFIIFL
jgi:hypothetical protein